MIAAYKYDVYNTELVGSPKKLQCGEIIPAPDPGPITNNQVDIIIRAKGTSGAGAYPRMELRMGGQLINAWNVAGDWADYSTTVLSQLSDNLRVYFTNDYYGNGEDRNLFVDYISVNGIVYQSEASTTYAKGRYVSGQGCVAGFRQTEELDCNNSFFEFPTSRAVSGISFSNFFRSWMVTMFSGSF